MTSQPSTRREQLIERLAKAQNSAAFRNMDIISITGSGVMDDDDYLEKYVQEKEIQAAEKPRKPGPFVTGQNSN
jgi:hypothetical protein